MINIQQRKIFNDKGEQIGCKRVLFGDIPEDYQIVDFLKNKSDNKWLSQLAAANILYQNNMDDDNLSGYQEYSFHILSLNYIVSADALRIAYYNELKDHSANLQYLIPCAYCCRHAVELLLKYKIMNKSKSLDVLKYGHNIQILWNEFKNHYNYVINNELEKFIIMLYIMDPDGLHLRYGFSKNKNNYEPYDLNSQYFDINGLVDNSCYLYDTVYHMK